MSHSEREPSRQGHDAFERALVAVRAIPPPPPPPFDSSRLSRPPKSTRWTLLAGIATVAAASVVFALTRNGPVDASLPFDVRAGAEFLHAYPSGVWTVTGPARFDFLNAEVAVEPGARFRIPSATGIVVTEGRVTFRMNDARSSERRPTNPPTDALAVRAGQVTVVDRGTAFGVDVSRDEDGERVLVTVTEGAVDAAGVAIGRGMGLAFVEGRPLGSPWSLGAKPVVSLEAESTNPMAGEPLVLRVVLANATDGWIPWPSAGTVENPVHVEISDPAGNVTPVRVTDAMLVDGPSSGRAIPPRGHAVLRVRFDRTFASPGTYRLRAIFRPAEAVEDPASASISLTVRAPAAASPTGPSTPGRNR